MDTPDPTNCARCGEPEAEHVAVEVAEGPNQGALVRLCPRSLYVADDGALQQLADES